MNTKSENGVRSRAPLWLCISVVFVLYLLQGVALGMQDVVSLYLASYGATWKQLGTLSFVIYPFSVKILWAPLIDVLYIRRLGRRQSWLLPIQILLGLTFIILSFHLESLLVQLRVNELTVIFFFIMLLTATQDICVDGWALTLFATPDIIWQSVSQMAGQPLGSFLGSPVLLTLESANLTNRWIRQPLGIADQPQGLFTMAQFVRFWGVAFLITTCAVTLLFRKQQQDTDADEKDEYPPLSLLETYTYSFKLFKKKCFRQLTVILVGLHFGYAATSTMTFVTLINKGLVRRETLGLITMPLILIKVTIPFLVSRTRRPLVFFAKSYIPRLGLCVLIAIFVFFGSHLQPYPCIFYGLLIILLGLNDALAYMQGAARGGFMAYISDTRVGSTYYTLIASLTNLGGAVSSSVVLYTANWLPKEQAYFIEVGVCLLLGCIWFSISWRLIHRLQAIPVECWHLKLHPQNHNGNHRLSIADNKRTVPFTVAASTELSSWL